MGKIFFYVGNKYTISIYFLSKRIKISKIIISSIMEKFFLFLSTVFFFYAISIISLAEALTLAFVSPIIVTVLSIFYLKKKSWHT